MNKWTLVTGGSKKLGAEICRSLAAQGKHLVVHYYTGEEEAKKLVHSLRDKKVEAEALYGDFSTIASTLDFIERYKKRFDRTEGLVNNVGPYVMKSSLKMDVEQAQGLIHMNLLLPLMLVQSFQQSLQEQKGFVINIGMTGSGVLSANTHATVYNMAKTALCMLTKSWAKELAKGHVRVNMVSPGYLEESIDLPVSLDALPMGRTVSWKEIARVVSFLIEPENGYITGQNIEVAGGIRL